METPNWSARSFPPAALALVNNRPFVETCDVRALAQAIVDGTREPLLVLDKNLCVVTANRCFYSTFRARREDVQGRPLHVLGDGQWNIPELRSRLASTARDHIALEAFEIEQELSGAGRRMILLNAHTLRCPDGNFHGALLLSIEDITDRHARERELKELLEQKEVSLLETRHRVANSLQIIASLLLMKSRKVRVEETRVHLRDAHKRIMAVATVQRQLQLSGSGEIELDRYLSRLCQALAASMIDDQSVTLNVQAHASSASSDHAVSLGLIVVELVINALKHAFPDPRGDATVTVAYDRTGPNWQLMVSDNGIGRPQGYAGNPGLGTAIINTLAMQLDARVDTIMNAQGTTVTIAHGTVSAAAVAGSSAK